MESKVLSTGIRYSTLPQSYIRPEQERPKLSQVSECKNVPIIDMGVHVNRPQIVQQIRDACRLYGFFQVSKQNYQCDQSWGVCRNDEKMLEVAHEFYRLPVEEKMKLYSDDPTKTMGFSTSFNVNKENVHNWGDYLRLNCYPLDLYTPEWPSNPPSFKEIVSSYFKEVRELGFKLQEMISESLDLGTDHIKNVLRDQGQHMAIKYYPPCPEFELTYELPGHTDPNVLTILLQDLRKAGLKILKDGTWLVIKPQPGAFVINIGHQLKAVSNAKYKSVWHRDNGNAKSERLSVASFLCPCNDAVIGPAQPLIEDGSAAIYRNFNMLSITKGFGAENWVKNIALN